MNGNGTYPAKDTGANRQIGGTQIEVLLAAARMRATDHDHGGDGVVSQGCIMIDPSTENAKWCAAKRLVRRGLLGRYELGGPKFGTVIVYTITDRGLAKLKEYGLH